MDERSGNLLISSAHLPVTECLILVQLPYCAQKRLIDFLPFIPLYFFNRAGGVSWDLITGDEFVRFMVGRSSKSVLPLRRISGLW